MTTRTDAPPADVLEEWIAERLHTVQLGCVMGDYGDPDTGSFGHGCIADHTAQARLLTTIVKAV